MLGALLLTGSVLLGQADAASTDDELKLQVRRLVRQLDAPKFSEREAAEAKLIELGPGILDLLPREPERTSAEVKQRVERIRQQLQRTMAESAGQASLVTLKGELPVSEIFAAIQEQTGNKIVARPVANREAEPKLSVDFEETPFWEALDQVADKAQLRLYPYGGEKALHVGPRPGGELSRVGRASYSGPFRFEAVMVHAHRDLRHPENQSLGLSLEVSWEPRLAPVTLQQRMADIEALDENGKPVRVASSEAVQEVPVAGDSVAGQLEIPLVLPPRDVKKIARLKGTLTAMLPSELETFRFENLETAEEVPRRVAGVTVILDRVRKNADLWEVRLRVRFDEAGGALESHRTWIFDNEVCLVSPNGKSIGQFTSKTTLQTENEVGIAYFFGIDGPLTGYVLVYKTPGLILSTELDYEIQDIELP